MFAIYFQMVQMRSVCGGGGGGAEKGKRRELAREREGGREREREIWVVLVKFSQV